MVSPFLQKRDHAFAAGLYLGALALYLSTLAPGLMQIDAGELAAAQYVFGVPHATGYPLFLVLGWLWQQVPLPITAIAKANVLAAIFTALSVGVLYQVMLLSLRWWAAAKPEKAKPVPATKPLPQPAGNVKVRNRGAVATPVMATPVVAAPSVETLRTLTDTSMRWLAMAGALIAATCSTYWAQGTSVEVYSLHLLCLAVILRQALICGMQPDKASNWYLLAAAVAVGFTNHMSTILALPAVGYLLLTKNRWHKNLLRRIGIMAGIGLAIVIPAYLILVWRAHQQPPLNWGYVVDWARLKYHITGKQFQVWVFSGKGVFKKQLGHFFSTLTLNYSLAVLLLVLPGLVALFRQRALGWAWLVWLVFTLLFSANYDIHDIDSYFLLAYIALATVAMLGAAYVLSMVPTNRQRLAAPVLLLWPLLNGAENFASQNQRQMHTFDQYSQSLIAKAPQNALILSRQWDQFIAASYYWQFVEGMRPDVTIIDRELLRRSWYYPQIQKRDPIAYAAIAEPATQFVQAIRPFEEDKPYDGSQLERLFQQINGGYLGLAASRPVLVTPELVDNEFNEGQMRLPAGYQLIPFNLMYLLVPTGADYIADNSAELKIDYSRVDVNTYAATIKDIHYRMLLYRAMYEQHMGKLAQAKKLTELAQALFPDRALPRELAM